MSFVLFVGLLLVEMCENEMAAMEPGRFTMTA
jgi:hypothetical protein